VRGSIRWNGVDLRDADLAELRSRIAAVFQDYVTYELTAADNIALGAPGTLMPPAPCDSAPGDAAIVGAAKRAGIHETLAALPAGYRTMLSRAFASDDASVALSGGQWQRVALARALLREDAELLILDEPSSGLDPEAEFDVHERLRHYRAGRSSLDISHRLGAARNADLIVVLEEGRVAEQGTHTELIAKGGTYARMFKLQASGFAP
jgi:ATP-binding cassette subfamily B protein